MSVCHSVSQTAVSPAVRLGLKKEVKSRKWCNSVTNKVSAATSVLNILDCLYWKKNVDEVALNSLRELVKRPEAGLQVSTSNGASPSKMIASFLLPWVKRVCNVRQEQV